MSKRQILMLLGVLTMVFLFLGFPSMLDKILALLIGLIIIIMAYSMPSQINTSINNGRGDTYKDERSNNLPFLEHKTETPSVNPSQMSDTISNSLSQ